ncbi:T9SS type A sorting domain-containing protein [Flavisolibacter tropicus]|uniref:Secretion system C-terminal sorting domain-containing protein n=1 Tax=Flavisolibacter tropicus TaxID=1492898 RepID=A0A172TX22_9BACT|nr:T9SS type A sorting domain-containing protein [Flavisolibacter tropicus]ANE51590.1 hypothetical protein SY85_14855 [Flavisolibacter tropicus]
MRIFILSLCLLTAMAGFTQQSNNQLLGYQEFPTMIRGHAVDLQGNQYYVGTFKGELTVKGQRLTSGEGQEDVFWLKTDNAGKIIRYKTFGSANSDIALPETFVFSENNSLSFSSRLVETVSFQGHILKPYLHAVSSKPITTSAIVNTDTAGNVKWAVRMQLTLTKLYASKSIIHAFATYNNLEATDIKVNDSIIVKAANSFGLLHLMFDTTGKLIKVKEIGSFFNGQSLQVRNVGQFQDEKLLLFLVFTGGSNVTVNGVSHSLRSFPSGYPMLLKTDTSYTDFKLKFLNPDAHSLGRMPLTLSASDSIYTIMNVWPNSPLYMVDGHSVPFAQNALVVFDSSLTAKRVVDLSRNYITTASQSDRGINFRELFIKDNQLFFSGYYRGSNESPIGALAQRDTLIPVFPNLSAIVNLNGASKSFIAKADLGLNHTSMQWYGEQTPYETSSLSHNYFHDAGPGKIAFNLMQDNVWNPFQINTDLQVETGSMQPGVDLADATQFVEYLSDGSRIVMGYARGRTAIDKDAPSIRSSAARKDAFICRIMPNGQVKWFHRAFSTLLSTQISKLTVRNNKAYFLINYGAWSNDSNYISINKQLYKVDISASLMAQVDSSGNLTVINLKEVANGEEQQNIRDFNFFSNGDLAFVTNVLHKVNYPGFPNDNGFYILRVHPETRQIIGARKLVGTPYPSINRIEIDKKDAIYLSYNVPGTSSLYETTMLRMHNGATYIDAIQLTNNTSSNASRVSHTGLMKLHWNGYIWAKRFSGDAGAAVYGNRDLLLINDKPLLLTSTQYNSKPVYWDGQLLHSEAKAFYPTLVQLDTAGALKGYKIFGMEISHMKNKADGRIYLSGYISFAQKIDTIQIAHSGFTDAIGLVLDSNLVAKNSYRLHTPYSETMYDFDIYRDSVVSFAYTAQTDPALSTARLTTEISDYEENAYLGTLVIKGQTPTAINTPLPQNTSVAITPNPVRDRHLRLAINTPELLPTVLYVYTADGQLIDSHEVRLTPGTNRYSISLPESIKPGVYQLVISNKKWKTVRSFLKL